MKYLTPAILASVCLFSPSCDKSGDDGATGKSTDFSTKVKRDAADERAGSKGPSEPLLVSNSFIEENWRLGEPETQGEIDFEAATTVEEKLQVAARIQATGPDDLTPILRRSLLHPDENLRTQAVLMAVGLATLPEEAADILTAAAFDQSDDVRAYAMEVIREQKPEAQLAMFENTIHSPQSGVAAATVMELGRIHTKPAFSILLEGFKGGDPDLAARINAEVRLVVDKQFTNYQEASTWWQANQEKFDDQLLQIAE